MLAAQRLRCRTRARGDATTTPGEILLAIPDDGGTDTVISLPDDGGTDLVVEAP